MLSYQHEYHAGNHADVLKHAALTLLIRALQRKETPVRVLDTHAGSGLYDLRSREARKNAEHEGGIVRALAAAAPPPEIAPYLQYLRELNPGSSLRRYPGSPLVARHLLRPGDHLELLELHPGAFARLRRQFGSDRQVHIHQRDCFEGLPALVPPPERRGLALVDPSYEVKEDFVRVVELLGRCYRRWPGGTYVIWYPLLRDRAAERFPGRIAEAGIRRIYRVQLQAEADSFAGLRGSGLVIVNPPFGTTEPLEALTHWLARVLAGPGGGEWCADWLVPE